jgi:biopolymer transport protein ExbD
MPASDVQSGGGGRKSKKKGGAKKVRARRKSSRVDFTPMCDLGFLLITFFLLTVTLSSPHAMDIVVPAKKQNVKNKANQNKVGDKQAFTILLGKDNRVWYYEGLFKKANQKLNAQEVNWGSGQGSLLHALIKKSRERNPNYSQIAILQRQLNLGRINKKTYKKQVQKITSYKLGIVVLVKAAPKSTYGELVHTLDELKIAHVGIYAIVKITPEEIKLLKRLYNNPRPT